MAELPLHVASAINTARSLYATAQTREVRSSAWAHAELIAAMMKPGRNLDTLELVYQAITTDGEDIDGGDGSLAQAARDALMPYACSGCGTEVDAPGQEPDHFGWCPRNKDQENRT